MTISEFERGALLGFSVGLGIGAIAEPVDRIGAALFIAGVLLQGLCWILKVKSRKEKNAKENHEA
jgi:hypothetical protein